MIVAGTLLLKALVAAAIFAGVAYLGVELSRVVAKYIQRPPEGITRTEPPLPWFLVGSAFFGAALALRGMDWMTLTMAAIVTVSLVGCWHSDVTYGKMPDAFTLVPIAAVSLSAIATQNWPLLSGVIVPFIPFGAMAYLSKGKGLGWDDAKFAALGGAILGMEGALLALATAGVVAVSVAWLRRRTRDPIPFGPYMIGAVALTLVCSFTP
ncbi:MAG TPA: prepilin peptidase [Candidatus Acidoferrales bacterium]|nr:prepilin peptidase [Candidatus Acidoferrales bacterium]